MATIATYVSTTGPQEKIRHDIAQTLADKLRIKWDRSGFYDKADTHETIERAYEEIKSDLIASNTTQYNRQRDYKICEVRSLMDGALAHFDLYTEAMNSFLELLNEYNASVSAIGERTSQQIKFEQRSVLGIKRTKKPIDRWDIGDWATFMLVEPADLERVCKTKRVIVIPSIYEIEKDDASLRYQRLISNAEKLLDILDNIKYYENELDNALDSVRYPKAFRYPITLPKGIEAVRHVADNNDLFERLQ